MTTDNQAGSATLLVLGALGGLMALTGRVPDRMGKEGIAYHRVAEDTVEELLTSPDTPLEVKQTVAAVYQAEEERRADKDDSRFSSGELSNLSSQVLFDAAVMHTLLTAPPPGTRIIPEWASTSGRVDAVVIGQDQSKDAGLPRVVIEIRVMRRAPQGLLAFNQLRSLTDPAGVTGVLILGGALKRKSERFTNSLFQVAVSDPLDNEDIELIYRTVAQAWEEAKGQFDALQAGR